MTYYEVAAKWWADELRKGTCCVREDIDKFETLLADRIRTEVETHGKVYLWVGYYPMGTLGTVSSKVHLPSYAFPQTASMTVTSEKVIGFPCGNLWPQ